MAKGAKLIVNFSGGEVSPLAYSRIDIPIYQKAVKKAENVIVLPQGGFRFRQGTMFVHNTRNNAEAYLYPFQFSDSQAYVIEATDKFFRFYTNNGIVLNATALTVSSVTQTPPGTTTFVTGTHGLNTGGEVQIAGYAGGGWQNANGNFYTVTVINSTTFSIPLDSSLYTAPTTTGTITPVYELATPYFLIDLPYLQFAQIADTAYITNNNYEPRKLIRKGNADWTLGTYTRTTDPFPTTAATITGITQANPGVITTGVHGYVSGQQVIISGIVGMTQLNGIQFLIKVLSTTTFSLTTLAGVDVNTTSYTAWSSGGTVQPSVWPRACSFSDGGRLLFGGTPIAPMSIWASAAPTTSATRYDVFTGGSLATDALAFTLAPVHGRIDSIEWITNTSNFQVIGTYGSMRTLYGASIEQPITPSAITSKSIATFGAANTQPISNGQNLFYIQRGGILLRSVQYDVVANNYITTDRNLVTEHLTVNGLKQAIEVQGQPDLIWVIRYDGKLLSLTFKDTENISAWSRHYFGGSSVNTKGIVQTFAKINASAQMLRNQSNNLFSAGDQIWFSVERRINGATYRSIEYLADTPVFPTRQDFDGISTTETQDQIQWENAMFESQKTSCHLDMALTYDGSQVGLLANAALTPSSAAVGTGVTVTASAAVFDSTMVGRQIWKQYDINGNGGGRAVITGYTSTTQVTVQILSAFDNTNAMGAGNWYLTATTLTGLSTLNGETVSVQGDGDYRGDFVVASGSIALAAPVSYAFVGYRYKGTVRTLNIDPSSQPGFAEAKARVIVKAFGKFSNTLGVKFGSSYYKMTQVHFRDPHQKTGRVPALFSGTKPQPLVNSWAGNITDYNKEFLITQEIPVPATITGIDLDMEFSNA